MLEAFDQDPVRREEAGQFVRRTETPLLRPLIRAENPEPIPGCVNRPDCPGLEKATRIARAGAGRVVAMFDEGRGDPFLKVVLDQFHEQAGFA